MQIVIDIPEDVLKRTVFYREFKDLNDCITTIKALEKATPLDDVKTGHWIETEENHGFDDEFRNKALSCSVCRVAFRISDYAQIEDFRYCPNCGARMDEE